MRGKSAKRAMTNKSGQHKKKLKNGEPGSVKKYFFAAIVVILVLLIGLFAIHRYYKLAENKLLVSTSGDNHELLIKLRDRIEEKYKNRYNEKIKTEESEYLTLAIIYDYKKSVYSNNSEEIIITGIQEQLLKARPDIKKKKKMDRVVMYDELDHVLSNFVVGGDYVKPEIPAVKAFLHLTVDSSFFKTQILLKLIDVATEEVVRFSVPNFRSSKTGYEKLANAILKILNEKYPAVKE